MTMQIHYYCALYRITGIFMVTNSSHIMCIILFISLANDINMFGSLDNFSCFKYENNMQKIKKKLRSGKPLEELINLKNYNFRFNRITKKISYCYLHKRKFLIYNISYLQFETFKINKTDNCALLYDMSVIFVLEIFEDFVGLYLFVRNDF